MVDIKTAAGGGNWGGYLRFIDSGVTNAMISSTADSQLALWTAGSERVRINASGNVGIGMTAAAFHANEKLSVGGSIGAYSPNANAAMFLGNLTTGAVTLQQFYYWNGSSWGLSGNISANAATTNYNTTSDRRLKEYIVDSALGLDTLLKIRVRDFSFIGDADHRNIQGFIAQELYDLYPDAVTKGDDGNQVEKQWAVDYGRLTPLLVKSLQELKADNDNLRAELKAANDNDAVQDAALEDLRREIEALKAAR